MHRESIYTLKLVRCGIHLRCGRNVDIMETVRVDEVMVRQPVVVSVILPVKQLAEEFIRTGRHGFPVVDEDGSLYGMVSLEDYRRAAQRASGNFEHLLLREITTRDIVSVYPDESVGTAMRRMSPRAISRLPVVARDDPRRLLGVVHRNDIMRAYKVGTLRWDEALQRVEQSRAVSNTRAQFIEVTLTLISRSVGMTVAELGLPRAAVLVSIPRKRDLLIPRGDTKLQSGDVVTMLCGRQYLDEARAALAAEKRSQPESKSKRETDGVIP
jgi:chloride channel protein, CIC family